MQSQLRQLIISKLAENKFTLQNKFLLKHDVSVARHFVLDNLLPTEIAENLSANLPSPRKMKLLNSYGELKLKYSHIRKVSNLLYDLHIAIQHPEVIKQIEEITTIKNQIPDKSNIAGGVSALLKGYYINPHLDNSHDSTKKLYRTVNVLYYLSPNWGLQNGGNYELWDQEVNHRIIIPCLFNRLLVVETNTTSWHSVNRVLCDQPRYCLFNYYFSPQSPEGREYFHSSSLFFNPCFKYRPEQKVRRAISKTLRSLLNKK